MTDIGTQNPFAPPRAPVVDVPIVPDVALVPAGRWIRLGAAVLDMVPVFAIGIFGALAGWFFAGGDASPTTGLMLGLVVLIAFVLMIAWFVWTIALLYRKGQTVGKRALGIRVVRSDGSRVRFWRFFFLRWLPVAVLGGAAGALGTRLHVPGGGYVFAALDVLLIFQASRRCLHDLFADTRVVTAASSPHATLAGSRRLPEIRI